MLVDVAREAPWAYLIGAAIVGIDAFFPAVPGETALISGGVLAASGELSLPLVLAAGVVGAALGDQVGYQLGRILGTRGARRLFRSPRAHERLERMSEQLRRRRVPIIAGARFVPGGRTAATFASGALGLGRREFTSADLLGVVLWVVYAVALGYLGGEAFGDSLWKPLLAALAVAALIGALGELVRRVRLRPLAGEPG